MRHILSIAIGIGLLSGMSGAAPRTITGELVEIACVRNGSDSQGAEHKACAVSCARGGAALGILTDEDMVEIVGEYTKNRNAKLLEFIAEEVVVTGDVTMEEGRPVVRIATIRIAKK